MREVHDGELQGLPGMYTYAEGVNFAFSHT
jgi:hypothetical protein